MNLITNQLCVYFQRRKVCFGVENLRFPLNILTMRQTNSITAGYASFLAFMDVNLFVFIQSVHV